MAAVFRIDSFQVPSAALPQFRSAAQRSLAVLRSQPGFVRDQWFERIEGTGRFNIVTLVEWQDASFLPVAGAAVRASHEGAGFDPEAFAIQHGIDQSKAVYSAYPA